jgi:hypothetical protein
MHGKNIGTQAFDQVKGIVKQDLIFFFTFFGPAFILHYSGRTKYSALVSKLNKL